MDGRWIDSRAMTTKKLDKRWQRESAWTAVYRDNWLRAALGDRQIDRRKIRDRQMNSRAMAAKTRYRDNWLRAAVRYRQMDGWEIDKRQIDSRAMAATRNQTRDGKLIVHRQKSIQKTDKKQQ